MENIQAALEHACETFQVPNLRKQAEEEIQRFRHISKPIPVCQYILEHSNSLGARFQAAGTLREAAVREWTFTAKEERLHLRSYLLHYIHRQLDGGSDVVTAQLIAAVASLLKRGWLESGKEERNAFFAELEAIVASSGSKGPARRAWARILVAVVEEFSPATASILGLPWDYHEKCRASLEADYLQHIYLHARSVARSSAAAALAGQDAGACQACLALMNAILSWDFRQAVVPMPVFGSGRPSSSSTVVKPGPAWRAALLTPDNLEWLSGLLAQLRGRPDLPLAASARQLLVLLCSVSGDIFPRADDEQERAQLGLQQGPHVRQTYLGSLLGIALPWVAPPDPALRTAAADSETELLDACRALSMLASVHRARGFLQAQVRAPTGQGPLEAVAALTSACIAVGGVAEAKEGTWAAEASDMLLDTWVELLYEHSAGFVKADAGASREASSAAAAVFQALANAALQDAAAGALDDEAEGEAEDDAGAGAMAGREEWFARAAAVGRAAAGQSAAFLAQCIAEKQQSLQQCATTGQDPSEALEALHWLTRMSAHLLADSGDGEVPYTPRAVAHAAGTAPRGQDPVEALSHGLLGVAGLCLDERGRTVASPRLMEAAAWASARWADSYLMPDEAASEGLQSSFGAKGGSGPQVVAVLLQIANTLLSQYTGEVDLHRVVVTRLLPVLTQRSAICMCLVRLEAWHALMQGFAGQAEPIRGLAGPTARALAKTLTAASSGLNNVKEGQDYINHLLQPLVEEVRGLAARSDLAAVAQRGEVMSRLAYLLEVFRGAMRGSGPKSQPALLGTIKQIVDPLVRLQSVYHTQPGVTCLILKLAADIVEAHVSFAQAEDATTLCQFVLHLLQQYAGFNQGQTSVAAATRLRAEAAQESCRDLKAQIKLLTLLTQRDVLDFGGDSSHANPDIAQVVFLGLDMVIPLMTGELLHFPKLIRAFFSLISYMLEVYPERVASLPEPQMRTLVATLEYGVSALDLDVVQGSLEALASLARQHYLAVSAGRPGITTPDRNAVLAGFLELVFRRLLLEDLGNDTVELAADALLPLILAHTDAYQSLGEKLLATQQDVQAREALTRTLVALTTSNGLETNVERNNRRRFRANLSKAVADARGFVRLQ